MKIEIFIPLKSPPTKTHQMKKVRVVNGKPQFYEPPELKSVRALYTAHLAKAAPPQPMTGPVALNVMWLWPADNKHPGGTPKTTKPDTDNLQKLLKDCMTAARWWRDDAQVFSEYVVKEYGEEPGIYIRAEEV